LALVDASLDASTEESAVAAESDATEEFASAAVEAAALTSSDASAWAAA
jgi:hypothetical protein